METGPNGETGASAVKLAAKGRTRGNELVRTLPLKMVEKAAMVWPLTVKSAYCDSVTQVSFLVYRPISNSNIRTGYNQMFE